MTTDTVGGVWTFTKELATELLRCGHHVTLVSFGREPSAGQKSVTTGLAHDCNTRFQYIASSVPLEWMPDNTTAYSGAESLILQLSRDLRPGALLLSQFCFGALSVPMPRIVIAHSDVLSWAEAVDKAPLANDVWLATYKRLMQRGLNSADAVAAPTQCMLRDLQRGFTVTCQTAVVPNGRSLPSPEEAPPHRILQAFTAGRLWDEAKNVRLLREVNAPMPLLLAGDVGNGLQKDWANVQCLGHLSEGDLLHRFRSSAIYICTSLYEPFGLAPLEAALCGCAVLANDIPSLREVWGSAALYFRDAASLSALLHDLHRNPEHLKAAQDRSGKRAAQYTVARMADAYLELISHFIEQHGRSEAHAA